MSGQALLGGVSFVENPGVVWLDRRCSKPRSVSLNCVHSERLAKASRSATSMRHCGIRRPWLRVQTMPCGVTSGRLH